MNKLLCAALIAFAATGTWASTSIDDPLQRQRFDAVVEELNQDADPNDVIPMLYDYMEFYIWIGYSDPTKFNPTGDIERTFGEAYTSYFSRMADRLNIRLGQCDPTVMEEIMEYLDFHEVGYSDGAALSDRERIEKSEFWSGYVQWQVNDELRDLIDDGDGEGPSMPYAQALEVLRSGAPEKKKQAAQSLGAERLGSDLTPGVLSKLLADHDSVVRYWAAAMLGKNRDAAQSAVTELRAALADHSWPVRHKVAGLLTQMNDRQSRAQAQAVLESAQAKADPWPDMPSPPVRRD